MLIILYALFATAATARSVVQMLRDFSFAPVAYLLSLAAALHLHRREHRPGQGRSGAPARPWSCA